MEYLKVFISQPMSNKSRDGIERERHLIMDVLPILLKEKDLIEIPMLSELVFCNNSPATCIGMAIQDMSNADIVVFAPGWRDARGCVVEHAVCLLYKIPYVELMNDSNGYQISTDGRLKKNA